MTNIEGADISAKTPKSKLKESRFKGMRRKKKIKRRMAWARLAHHYNVSYRTLDRWALLGVVEPPEIINGRKFGDADEQPRLDVEAA
jgi:hypothetical protein